MRRPCGTGSRELRERRGPLNQVALNGVAPTVGTRHRRQPLHASGGHPVNNSHTDLGS
jgi:hypothetical protein